MTTQYQLTKEALTFYKQGHAISVGLFNLLQQISAKANQFEFIAYHADNQTLLRESREVIADELSSMVEQDTTFGAALNAFGDYLPQTLRNTYNYVAASIACLGKARTRKEYAEQRAYLRNKIAILKLQLSNTLNSVRARVATAQNNIARTEKALSTMRKPHILPKSGMPKHIRKALTRSYINNRVTNPEYFVNAEMGNRVIYARLAVILKRGIERSYVNASTCASIKSAAQIFKFKYNHLAHYRPLYDLAAALRWAQADRKAYLSNSPQGRILYINRLPV